MQQIRAAGADACGILFGTHQDDVVRILAWRREQAEGRDLVRTLLAAKSDTELQAMQPVGWFVSHASGDISLSDPDIEIFDGFFGEPWQVTLVLVPDRAGFFVREAGGGLYHHELAIARKPQYLRWLWAIPTVVAAILAAMLIKTDHPVPALHLRVQPEQISWDPVETATKADIDIEDSGPVHFQLNGAQVRNGRLAWKHRGSDVQVRMTVYPGPVRESAHLTITTVTVHETAPAPPDPEVPRLTEELRQERLQTEKLRNMVKILENRLEIDTARGK